MAQIKLWHIDTGNRTSSGAISDTIDYVVNPEKTTVEVTNDVDSVVEYIERDSATNEKLISSINCSVDDCIDEFEQVKETYGKTSGYVAWHGEQSFAPGEISAEDAHRIGVELAERLWGGEFQVIVATHTDKNHIHNHFVFNSVSYVDGHKYNYSNKELFRLRNANDQICVENGLSVIDAKGHGQQYKDWYDNKYHKYKTTKRGMLEDDIDEAIKHSSSFRNFLSIMKSYGYDVKEQKANISFRYKYDENGTPIYGNKYLRLNSLHNGYKENDIYSRILNEYKPIQHKQTDISSIKANSYYRYKGTYKKWNRSPLYSYFWFYVFRVNKVAKSPAQYPRSHYAARKDIVKLHNYSENVRFISSHHLDTLSDVNALLMKDEKQLNKINEIRDNNRLRMRKATDLYTQKELYDDIIKQTEQLKTVRNDIKICKRIIETHSDISLKVKAIRNDESNFRKGYDKKEEHQDINSEKKNNDTLFFKSGI